MRGGGAKRNRGEGGGSEEGGDARTKESGTGKAEKASRGGAETKVSNNGGTAKEVSAEEGERQQTKRSRRQTARGGVDPPSKSQIKT